MRTTACLIMGLALAAPAWSGEVPRYEAAPAWVLPAPPPKTMSGGAALAIMDQQTRLSEGSVWSYREIATRALSADMLAHMGTLALNWQPFHGDLIVHRVQILRDGRSIDVLKAGQTFKVIRREQGLERLELNGVLTATMQVEGLEVGDILDVTYSVSSKDPALRGGVQAEEIAPFEPVKVDFARASLLWPASEPIRWTAFPKGLTGDERIISGWRTVTFALPAPKPADLPPDAPRRFQPVPLIEATSFADWQAVSRVFAPLYATDGLITPGGSLAQAMADIRSHEADPTRRTAAALSLVQDRIRYFANGMNGGNYVPQAPERTWAAGFGDCKAKTLLLLAILRELGVQAEPVLANIGQGDLIAERLPSPGAFNHILVHAQLEGRDLWLDGTARGSRLEDLTDVPPFKAVLPVRSEGAALLRLTPTAPQRANRQIAIDLDESAGIGLPAPFSATVQLRGAIADSLRALAAQLDNEKLLAVAFASLGGRPVRRRFPSPSPSPSTRRRASRPLR